MRAEPLFPDHDGAVSGPVLALSAPLSFWGGVDPATGRIIQVRHPQCGASIAGTVLALPGTPELAATLASAQAEGFAVSDLVPA